MADPSKTEKPTPKKLQEAKEQGQIAKTQELTAGLSIVAGSYILPWLISSGGQRVMALWDHLADVVGNSGVGVTNADDGTGLVSWFATALAETAVLMAPIVLGMLAMGLLANLVQTKGSVSSKRLKPKVDKLNPIKGFKNIFGPHAIVELVKNLIKLTLIGVLAWPAIGGLVEVVMSAGFASVPVVARAIGDAAIAFVRSVGWATFVVAAADYAYQRKRTMDQLKMSKQDIKDEHKQSEGDPHVKGQIKQRMAEMTRNRMMAAIPDADVVIVNPTHLSIVLRYDAEAGAPRVVAKGAGVLALRIREVAREHHLPIVHDKPLARTLFRLVDVEQTIPVALYEAVARVLAFVYTLRTKGQAAGWHESPFASRHESLTALSPRELLAAGRG